MESQNSTGQNSSAQPADSTVLITSGQFGTGTSEAREAMAPGTLVGGAYKIQTLLGRGGMGDVYKARHIVLEKDFAIKVLTGQELNNVNWLRFQTEAKVISRLNHRNIVKVFNLGLHDGSTPFYAMDLLEGEPLDGTINRLGPLGEEDAVDIFLQVCDGLSYAHRQGIIHRDIKPANIMLIVEGDKPLVKLLDFGIAKLSSAESKAAQSLTAPGEVFGSPLYMSPEQCIGLKVDARSDIYSLGCALFECLTGRPPFKGENAFKTICMHQSDIAPSLKQASGGKTFSQGMEQLVARALKKKPEERYQSMKELEVDFLRVAQGKDLNRTYISMQSDDPLRASGSQAITGRTSTGKSTVGRTTGARTTSQSGRVTGRTTGFRNNDLTDFSPESDNVRGGGNNRGLIWLGLGLAVTTALVGSVAMFIFTDRGATAVVKTHAQADIEHLSLPPKGGDKELRDISSITYAPSTADRKHTSAPVKIEHNPLNESRLPPLKGERNSPRADAEDCQKLIEVMGKTKFDGRLFNRGDCLYQGRQASEYYFPEFGNMGRISWDAGQTPDGHKYGANSARCKGALIIPRGAKFRFEASNDTAFSPSCVEGFQDGELIALKLTKYNAADSFISHLHKIKSLTDIDLTKSDVTDKSFAFIDQQKNLKRLVVKTTDLTGGKLAQLKTLRQLEVLNVREIPESFKILPQLKGDLVIRELRMGDQQIKDSDIAIIRTMKNLEVLDLNLTRLTDEQLKQLAPLTRLHRLSASNSHLSPACVDIIKKQFPLMQDLAISSDHHDWTDDVMSELKTFVSKARTANFNPRHAEKSLFAE